MVREERVTKAITSTTYTVASTLRSTLDSMLTAFVDSQEALNFGFIGTGNELGKVTKLLGETLGDTGLVKQEAVYKNLSDLVNQGIVYNVEQRAFLQTIADDLGGIFNASDGTLTRLINLQRRDLTSNCGL